MGSVAAVKSIPEILSELTELVRKGDMPGARRLGRRLEGRADVRQLRLVAAVVKVRETRPNTARVIVGQWWKQAHNEADRALIAACMPEKGEKPRERLRSDSPRATRRTRRAAADRVTTEQRAELIKKRNTRQELADAALMARYEAERAGVADGPQVQDRDERAQAEKVYASGFDYDCAALYGTEIAFRCLGCTISRGRYDLDRVRMQAGTGDDGLCSDCREKGIRGIPELPAGHTKAEAIKARCDFVWQEVNADLGVVVAVRRLKSQWREGRTPFVRAIIGEFGTEQVAAAEVAAEQAAEAPAELNACGTCGEARSERDVRGVAADDFLCKGCRADEDEAQEAEAWERMVARRCAEAQPEHAGVPA